MGMCDTDIPRIAAAANEAQQRLLTDPLAPDEGWYGGYAQYAFTVASPFDYITAPREVARIISMTACKKPMKIRNQFFEFLDFGIGNQPSGCGNSQRCGQQFQTYERDNVPTINTFVAGNTIRAYPLDSRDVGKRSLIQGTDSNDKTIYGTSVLTGKPILGETISLDIPFVDTSNDFNSVLSIQKEPTVGDVVYYQVDQVTGAETPLHTMQATEQTGQYRRYFLNGLKNTCCQSPTQQVLALCKLDFVPVQSDQDYLLIQSIPALIEEGMAVRYSRMDTPGSQQMAQSKHANALRLLFGQLDHFLGKFQTAITVPIFGSDRLRFQAQ
jgi:hypothetical protein